MCEGEVFSVTFKSVCVHVFANRGREERKKKELRKEDDEDEDHGEEMCGKRRGGK